MKDNPRKAPSPQGNPEPPSFTAVAEIRPEAFFIIAQGELDLTTADICAVLFNQAIESGSRIVALDLRRVRYVDSEGLNILLNLRQRLDEAQRVTVVLVAESTAPCAVLRTVQFNHIMHIVTRPEEVRADLPLVGHLGPVPGKPARLPEGAGPRGQSYFSGT